MPHRDFSSPAHYSGPIGSTFRPCLIHHLKGCSASLPGMEIPRRGDCREGRFVQQRRRQKVYILRFYRKFGSSLTFRHMLHSPAARLSTSQARHATVQTTQTGNITPSKSSDRAAAPELSEFTAALALFNPFLPPKRGSQSSRINYSEGEPGAQ